MENKISITEEDLFKFVFYRNELPEEKQKYLEENEELFSAELDFVKSFFNKAEANDEFQLSANAIILFPDNVTRRELLNNLRLAAASETLDKNIETISFKDSELHYTIRQVKQKNKNQLFIFPKEENQSKNIILTLYPSNLKYHSSKSATSIELPVDASIERIAVTEET